MATAEKSNWWLYFFIPVVLALSVFILYQTTLEKSVAEQIPKLDPLYYTIETARGETLQNTSMVGNCHLCHAYWVPIPRTNQTSNPRFAHANIQLNHGKNDRCYNCHMISDRNKYVANDGAEIITRLPVQMCGRCHGLIFKDWQLGTHGKWTGMWKPQEKNDKTTYTCTQCHDPHDPKFKYNKIAPPPVWPEKYLRTKFENSHSDPSAQFLIGEEPKEIF